MEQNAPVTARRFYDAVGRFAVDDDLQRSSCAIAGEIGHWACGWCETHNAPRFHCGCFLVDGQAVSAPNHPVPLITKDSLRDLLIQPPCHHPCCSHKEALIVALLRNVHALKRAVARSNHEAVLVLARGLGYA